MAPANWLSETCSAILTQANLQESDNPRVSPIAFVRCSRGGKTRAMMEIMAQIRRQDPSYSILFVTLNTATPLPKIHSLQKYDPVAELCVRIAFGALKSRQPYNREEFEEFSKHHSVDEVWVKDWLQDEKCILFIDELNLLQGSMDENMAEFLKNIFLLDKGRGLVFSSHVASISRKLATFMSSPGNREVITRPLPFIPSLQIAREKLKWQNLSAREALYLGLIPGLLVEKKNNRPTTTRRAEAVQEYIQSVGSDGCTGASVALLLSTLLTGNVESVDEHLQELMTADIAQDGETTILRWIPFHMSFVLQQVSQQCLVVPLRTRHCYSAIAELLVQFGYGKWESGDAWEALFLVVLIVRCLSTKFDDHVVPLAHCPFSEEGCVGYNYPYGGSDFFTKDPAAFIGGIPISSWGQGGQSAISIYYPGHARFEAYDIILAAWDRTYGTRTLYGYQLKDGSATPKPHAFDNIFEKSFLIRGAAKLKTTSVKRWNAVSDSDLDAFFGESALQWSAKAWKKLESAN